MSYFDPPGGHKSSGGFPPPGAPPGGYGVQPDAPSATVALVLGLIGFFVCFIPGIFGIVYARKTREEIAASGGRLGGEGKAKAGMILGILSIVIQVGLLLVYIIVIVLAVSTGDFE